jgi:hypothetical protein
MPVSEEAFSVTFVGLFGCCLGFLSMLCTGSESGTAIVVAGGSWTSITGVSARIHLLTTFLFQELDQVVLDFTLARLCWPPSAALSFAASSHGLPASAAFGRHRRTELGRHLRRSASAELGSHPRHLAAIGEAWP